MPPSHQQTPPPLNRGSSDAYNLPDSLPRARSEGVPFGDLRTIDAKDLIRVHDVCCHTSIPKEFKEIFEANRRLRNQFIHGIIKESRITERQIYSDVIAGFFLLNEQSGKTWSKVRRAYLSSSASESVVDDLQLALGKVILEVNRIISLFPPQVLT